MITASYLNKIKPSPTLSLSEKAKELKSQGIDVLSLSVGEPDVDTPNNIKQAAVKAINEGKTKYTAVDGMPELKDAIIKKFEVENNLIFQRDEILVSCGGKQAIFNCMLATINPGDEVLIPAPYWVSYPDIVEIARGVPIILETKEQDNFKLQARELENKITSKTKWLILNSPSNPTGQVYSQEELKELGEVLAKYPNIYILSDDLYEHLIYGQQFFNIATVCSKLKKRVMIVNGVSKAYAMTGWRIGYAAGNKQIIKKMRVLQSQSTSNPCSISQYAALEALNGEQNFLIKTRNAYIKRRDLSFTLINNIKGLSAILAQGSFYMFVNCKYFLNKKTVNGELITDDNAFCQYLLDEAAVTLVPGSAFGMEGYFRLSYAVAEDVLLEAIGRIRIACEKIMK